MTDYPTYTVLAGVKTDVDGKTPYWAYEDDAPDRQTITRWGKNIKVTQPGFMDAASLSSGKCVQKTRNKIFSMEKRKLEKDMDLLGNFSVTQTGRMYPLQARSVIERSFTPAIKWQYHPPQEFIERKAVEEVFLKRKYYTIMGSVTPKYNRLISDSRDLGMSYYSQRGVRWEDHIQSGKNLEHMDFYAYEVSMGLNNSMEYKLKPDLCYDSFSTGNIYLEDGFPVVLFWLFVQKRLADVGMEHTLELFLDDGDTISFRDIEKSMLGKFGSLFSLFEESIDDLFWAQCIKRTKIAFENKPMVLSHLTNIGIPCF